MDALDHLDSVPDAGRADGSMGDWCAAVRHVARQHNVQFPTFQLALPSYGPLRGTVSALTLSGARSPLFPPPRPCAQVLS